jgi:hypothetical protein
MQMYEKYKTFYTLISRSLQGTLILNSNDSIKSDFNVISVEQNSYEPYVVFSKESKKESIEWFTQKQTSLLDFIESLNLLNSTPEPEEESESEEETKPRKKSKKKTSKRKSPDDIPPIPTEEILGEQEDGFTDDSDTSNIETSLQVIEEIKEDENQKEE